MRDKRNFKVLLSLDRFEIQQLKNYASAKGIALASVCRMIIREKLNIGKKNESKPIFE